MAAATNRLEDQRGLVKLQGDLTALVVPEMQVDLRGMIESGVRELVFDLSNAEMLDSSGIGLLIATANSLATLGRGRPGNERIRGYLPAAAEHAIGNPTQREPGSVVGETLMDANQRLDLDDELLAEFINESREHLTTIETDLLAIEASGADINADLVNKVFRAAHSIKGASGFFGLNNVKELAHKAETVLDMIRSRKMTPNAEITNILLAAFDQLRQMINHPV